MPVRVELFHGTRYDYERAVWLSPHDVRLRPAPHTRALIESYALTVQPASHRLHWQQDAYGNSIARVVFAEPVSELMIDVRVVAELRPANPFDFLVDPAAAAFPFSYTAEDAHALTIYLEREHAKPRLRAWMNAMRATLLGAPIGTIEFLLQVTRSVARDIRYTRRLEAGVQSCEATLAQASGSCRDSAWLLAQALRHCGVASRFVSGYLVQLASPEASATADALDSDVVELHAWCEAYVPGAGWIGFDPTSGLMAAEGHIPLACAAVAEATAPVKGYATAGESRLSVEMRVTRVPEGASTSGPLPASRDRRLPRRGGL